MFATTGDNAWNRGIRPATSFSSIRWPPWPMPSRAVRRRGSLPPWSICSRGSSPDPRPPGFAAPTFSTWRPRPWKAAVVAWTKPWPPSRTWHGHRPAARRAVVGAGGADPRRTAFRPATVGEPPAGPGHVAVGVQSLLARVAALPGHRRPGLRGPALSCADAGPACPLGCRRRRSLMAETSPQPPIAQVLPRLRLARQFVAAVKLPEVGVARLLHGALHVAAPQS